MATYFLNCSDNLENFNLCLEHNVAGFPSTGYYVDDLIYLIVKNNNNWYLGAKGKLKTPTTYKPWRDFSRYQSSFEIDWEKIQRVPISTDLRTVYDNFGLAIQGKKNLDEFQGKGEQIKSKLDKYFMENMIIDTINSISEEKEEGFQYLTFNKFAKSAGLFFTDSTVLRFTASLLTKPFVILTGLSGSGKTKLAQAFVKWICENENQYRIIPIGADWTNREPLLGFPNALKEEEYVKPDNRVLDLIIDANKDSRNPYFLILDEMNLSHVERYFADFLSVMESKEEISLHSGSNDWNDIPAKLRFPKNLFIIGTVNIDETTYMFSPKVLDRANVIEFRVTSNEMESFLQNSITLDLKKLEGKGSNSAQSFVEKAINEAVKFESSLELNNSLLQFFVELKKIGAEFGYRSTSEITRFASIIKNIEQGIELNNIIDISIMQKLLPKVHGSRRKLEPVLRTLGKLCLTDGQKFDDFLANKNEIDNSESEIIKFPISLEKIVRMYENLISNGFTSYAEA